MYGVELHVIFQEHLHSLIPITVLIKKGPSSVMFINACILLQYI